MNSKKSNNQLLPSQEKYQQRKQAAIDGGFCMMHPRIAVEAGKFLCQRCLNKSAPAIDKLMEAQDWTQRREDIAVTTGRSKDYVFRYARHHNKPASIHRRLTKPKLLNGYTDPAAILHGDTVVSVQRTYDAAMALAAKMVDVKVVRVSITPNE